MSADLLASDGVVLLRIARRSILSALEGSSWTPGEDELTEAIRRSAGAFVTLKIEENLRGCIGSIYPAGPLWKAVLDNALSAAFHDPRFRPVSLDEFRRTDLEVSVMGPVEETAPAEIVVGRDGIIIRKGPFAGLLLPQVATEFGWDRETFLDHTCMKAGLPATAWRGGGCRIEKFSAQVFSE
jgi:AmmeMemoRadiSam system protein A